MELLLWWITAVAETLIMVAATATLIRRWL